MTIKNASNEAHAMDFLAMATGPIGVLGHQEHMLLDQPLQLAGHMGIVANDRDAVDAAVKLTKRPDLVEVQGTSLITAGLMVTFFIYPKCEAVLGPTQE